MRSDRYYVQYIITLKMHSSCEIEDFVETHLCKLCVVLRSRVLRVVHTCVAVFLGWQAVLSSTFFPGASSETYVCTSMDVAHRRLLPISLCIVPGICFWPRHELRQL